MTVGEKHAREWNSMYGGPEVRACRMSREAQGGHCS